ncbi:protein slowmo-like [Diabrotica undecimpunctata]|uniref:protein slowmo-like n=1 Tax=Diabrotica undecimpunctata TaxID=50387 RepID=UPI003B64065E
MSPIDFFEQSEVNPSLRHMVLKTINLTFCRHIAVNETLKYTPHPSDPTKTLLKQEAVVTVKGVPLTNYMEDLLTTKISNNAGKGRQAMEWVINKLNDEVKDLTRSTDEIFSHTKRSLDDIATSAKKSMGDISQKAKKSLDHMQTMTLS